jgi:hypothetical protein
MKPISALALLLCSLLTGLAACESDSRAAANGNTDPYYRQYDVQEDFAGHGNEDHK